MQEDKEKKQQFLREQILEAGHDAEEFIEFLSGYQLGNDIDQISYAQLKEVVESYCKKKVEQSISITRACKQLGFDQNSVLKFDKKQTNTVTFEKYGAVEPQMVKTFKCRKIKPQKILEDPPRIEINNYERKSVGGLFGLGRTSFWLFEVVTEKKKWKVKRRYTDFQWLRDILIKFFPTYIIPPLPRKKASKKTVKDIDKRMRIITYFVNDIASYPEIFTSKYVQAFMSMTNDSEFQKLKKEGLNAQSFETIVSLETASGEVTVEISEEQKIFSEELNTLLIGAEGLYKGINNNARVLQDNFLQQSNTLYMIGNQFADLQSLLKTFNTKLPQFAQTSLNYTYTSLNNMMIEWGNIVKNQHEFIQKNFLPFFRYTRHQLFSFRQLASKVTLLQQDYFKTKVSLDKKKDKLFDQNDVSKWKIPQHQLSSIPATATKNKQQAFEFMLPEQSSKLDILRLNYAFYASQFKDHALNLLQHKSKRFNDNFKQFAINVKVNTQQMAGLWTEVATNFADPHRKLSVMRSIIPENNQEEYIDEE